MTSNAKELDVLLQVLEARFGKNMKRHAGIAWPAVRTRLDTHRDAIDTLKRMEDTGGEPDVIGEANGRFVFCDCSPESPVGRRSTCYDAEARESRKENRPESSAIEMAADIGIELLSEAQYRQLQELGAFDTKTSSWVQTPVDVRALGGALFCDRRYGKVFTYHNGAPSYYAARGFRGWFQV